MRLENIIEGGEFTQATFRSNNRDASTARDAALNGGEKIEHLVFLLQSQKV